MGYAERWRISVKTCFVIMPIGSIPGGPSETDLRARYSLLIKDALARAAPGIEITRADEVAAPGTINSDIITRIMHSDLVIADITFPNPNVFYELGLRHAAKAGTILIKEGTSGPAPFDVHALRHIPYENSLAGLAKLEADLRRQIEFIEKNPGKPDNSFLEMAALTKFSYPATAAPAETSVSTQVDLYKRVLSQPELMVRLIAANEQGRSLNAEDLQVMMTSDPELVGLFVRHMITESGESLIKMPTRGGAVPQKQPPPSRGRKSR